MNQNLDKLIKLQVLHFFVLGFIIFLSYDVWKVSDTVGYFFLYYFLFTVYRLIAMPIAAKLVLNNKIKEVILISFIFTLLMSLFILLFVDYIDNPIYLMNLYALPIAFFTTFYQTGINQIIAQFGKDEDYDGFFYLTGLWKNFIDMLVPILLGAIITYISYKLSFIIMIVVSIYSIYVVFNMEKIENGFNGEGFKDIFKKVKTKIPKKISFIHYIFIFLSSFFLQYLDMGIASYQFTALSNDLGVGILKSVFVVAIYILFKYRSKLKWSDKVWFVGASVVLVMTLIYEILFTGNVFFILFILVITMYVLNSSSTSISFKLIDDNNNFGKFAVLFKRELVRTLSKILVTLVGFFFAIESIYSIEYKIYSSIMVVLLLLSIVAYCILDKYIYKDKK